MEIRNLDSRSIYGIPSVNKYEQIIKQIVETSPSWQNDGGGIRGRTIVPILSGPSSSGGMTEFIPQQFNQNNNETIQKKALDPVSDLILGGGGGGGTVLQKQPWDLIVNAEDPQDPDTAYFVTVRAGTLNNVLAENWNEEFICNNSSLFYANAIIQTDGEHVIGLNIDISTTPPEIQAPQIFSISDYVYYNFGLFFQGEAFRTISDGNITMSPVPYLVTDRPSPEAGQLAYQISYMLQP